MFTRIKRLLAPPVFADEEKTRTAALFNVVAWATVILIGLRALFAFIFLPHSLYIVSYVGLGIVLSGGMLRLVRSGYVRLASFLYLSLGFGIVTIFMLSFGGIQLPVSNFYLLLIVSAGLLLGGRAAVGFAGISIIAYSGLALAEFWGFLPQFSTYITLGNIWAAKSAQCIATAIMMYLASRTINEAFARYKQSNRELVID